MAGGKRKDPHLSIKKKRIPLQKKGNPGGDQWKKEVPEKKKKYGVDQRGKRE